MITGDTLDFLPVNYSDMKKRGWKEVDFVYITGEAYVDHPSFGHAVITRVLESAGYKVGIIAQPDWKKIDSVKIFGTPRLGFMIGSGVIDSMVNNYSVAKRKRTKDVYSEGGKMGKRPDRATIVYSKLVREAYGDIPIIIGGVEASLRRFAHYDYWSDKVMNSVLVDSEADLISFGMGEKTIIQIADLLNYGEKASNIKDIRGIVYKTNSIDGIKDYVESYSAEEVKKDKIKYAEAFKAQYEEQDPIRGKTIVQKHGDIYVVQTPPPLPLPQEDLDAAHELPYMRTYHPMYKAGVPSIEEVQFSVIAQRGCFGNCSFCSIAFHQGRIIQPRSHESIIKECEKITQMPSFKGYIHDVGGPTANFRQVSCKKQLKVGACKNRDCLFPEPCPNLYVSHTDFISLLRKIRKLPKIKKVFIRSGIRYDYVVADKDKTFLKELCKYHVSGQLKVAPEHVSNDVLYYMGKPTKNIYEKFVKSYEDTNKKLNLKQYLVPYLMSSHPGSTLKSAIELAEYLRDTGHSPEQVQDFYPTPGTLSTCMYYTGIDPLTMKKVYVPKTAHEKAMQRALLQYKNPANYQLVLEALKTAHREDLIGYDKKCLIRPAGSGSGRGARKEYDGKPTRENNKRERNFSKDKGGVGRRGNEVKGKRDKNRSGRSHGRK